MKNEDSDKSPLNHLFSTPDLDSLLRRTRIEDYGITSSSRFDPRYFGKEPEPQDTSEFEYTHEKPIIGYQRTPDEKIEAIVSKIPEIVTDRHIDFSKFDQSTIWFGAWIPGREATVVPLAIEETELTGIQKTDDYTLLPDHVKELFDNGKILRTSDRPASHFQALMYVQNSHVPEGRTGVLLYQGEPVTVEIDGKEFIVEIKGVGIPNGNNQINERMARSSYFGDGTAKYGGLEVEQGQREFRNLETIRAEKSPTFQAGNSPRAALHVEYDGKVNYGGDDTQQGYLLRLTPSSLRASYNGNKDFPEIESKSNKTARDLATQFVEYMKLDAILIHTCAHSENLVLTNDGFKFTDFSDMRTLAELENPHKIVERTFTEYVDEIPNRTDQDIEDYARTLSAGLGIRWSDDYKDTTKLAEAIWKEWVAPRVFQQRLQGQNAMLAEILSHINRYVETPDEIDAKIIKNAAWYENDNKKDVASQERQLKELDEWEPNFAAMLGDVDALREHWKGEGYDRLDDEQLISFAQGQHESRINGKPKIQEKLQRYTKEAKAYEAAQGDPAALASINEAVVPGVPSSLNLISRYLKNEIDVLTTVGTEETEPLLERANQLLSQVEQLRADPSNGYNVVNQLRENPNFLVELTRVYERNLP